MNILCKLKFHKYVQFHSENGFGSSIVRHYICDRCKERETRTYMFGKFQYKSEVKRKF